MRAIVGSIAVRAAPLALLALLAAGCAKRPPAAGAVTYPYAAEAPRTFYASVSGLVESPPPAEGAGASAGSGDGAAGGEAEGLPSTRAPNASALSSDGTRIVAAINGWGIACIRSNAGLPARTKAGGRGASEPPGASEPSGLAYRIEGIPLSSIFAGLTAAGMWPKGSGFLIQLYRDPFTEAPSPASHLSPPPPLPATRLAFYDARSGAVAASEAFSGSAEGGFELFALLPSKEKWFAELRKEGPSRVELKFLALEDPLATAATGATTASGATGAAGAAVEVGRADFEAALEPKGFAGLECVGELRSALRALGSGPWLVRLRADSGADSWYLSSGKAEEAAPAYAWSSPSGTIALRSDGWLALSKAGSATRLLSLGEPEPGAVFTSLASAGGLVAAAWESGEFPNIVSAGLVIAPLPR